MRETEKIWMNGEFIDWADARIHVGRTDCTTGPVVFEGFAATRPRRGRTCSGSPSISSGSQLGSAAPNRGPVLRRGAPGSVDRARSRDNRLPECYLRPIAFAGYGELGVSTRGNPMDVVIMSWPWGAYLGERGSKEGHPLQGLLLEARRGEHDPARLEGNRDLRNSVLAVNEANRAGYDEAILLTDDGFVADSSGENVFVVRDGPITTPPLSPSSCRESPAAR